MRKRRWWGIPTIGTKMCENWQVAIMHPQMYVRTYVHACLWCAKEWKLNRHGTKKASAYVGCWYARLRDPISCPDGQTDTRACRPAIRKEGQCGIKKGTWKVRLWMIKWPSLGINRCWSWHKTLNCFRVVSSFYKRKRERQYRNQMSKGKAISQHELGK